MNVSTDIIDVSHYDLGADLATAKSHGLLAVIAKCTQGKDYVDPGHARFRDDCRKLGLLFGDYHFGSASTDGRTQADWYLYHADPDALHCLDWEWNPNPGGEMTLEMAEAFVSRVHEITGRWPLVYCARAFVVHAKVPPATSVLANCPLWVSWYGDAPPHLPLAPWKQAELWQYTDVANGPRNAVVYPRTTPGLGRKVDRSAFLGDEAALRAWWHSVGLPRGPQCSTPGGP